MNKALGILLLLGGIYFLGRDIIFTTSYSPYFWRSTPAMGSVLAIVGGIGCLVFARRQTGYWGWGLLVLGIVLVFASGGVILQPTSLLNFVIALVAMAWGYQLLTRGRFRI